MDTHLYSLLLRERAAGWQYPKLSQDARRERLGFGSWLIHTEDTGFEADGINEKGSKAAVVKFGLRHDTGKQMALKRDSDHWGKLMV